jgi:hypothetical protein
MMQDLPEPPETDTDVRDTSRRDRIISVAIAIAVAFAVGAVAGQASSGGDAAKTAPVTVPAPTTASGGHLEPGETATSGGAEAICEAHPELESCGGTGSRRVVTITKTITETAEKTKTAAPEAFSFGDGTYRVGPAGVPAGTYKAPGGGSCYWERLSGFSGELNTSSPTTSLLGIRSSRSPLRMRGSIPRTAERGSGSDGGV